MILRPFVLVSVGLDGPFLVPLTQRRERSDAKKKEKDYFPTP
jgi:hypothetical protein